MSLFYYITALCIMAAWPVIPLFWIPAHLFHGFLRRRVGRAIYVITGIAWLPCLWVVLQYGDSLLECRLSLPAWISVPGWIIFLAGLLLQSWTAWVMGSVIIGIPEITDSMESRHVTAPPFNWCRHPTYLSHSMIFGGAAFMTGYYVLFVIAALDFLITCFIIIPFEEKELVERLGPAYRKYMETTSRFFPSFSMFSSGSHDEK